MSRLITIKGRERRHKRIRAQISGTTTRPRISIFRSNKYLSAQGIDDEAGKTLVSATTQTTKGKTNKDKAEAVGKLLAGELIKKGIKEVVFDRGGYLYAGKVRALADGLRAGGLIF